MAEAADFVSAERCRQDSCDVELDAKEGAETEVTAVTAVQIRSSNLGWREER